ncbi:MAG: hypothetical protein GY777_32040 [Candidatus Brocadiaceae bacterium]|nr:hypothetical protein [Candidatus Brocadiaceae bacterium]
MLIKLRIVLMTVLVSSCIVLTGCGLVTITDFEDEKNLRVQLDKKNEQIEKLKNETQKKTKSIEQMKNNLNRKEKALAEAERHVKRKSGREDIKTTGEDIRTMPAFDELPTSMAKPGECYARVFSPPTYKTITEEILESEPSEKVEIIPAKYELVEKRIITKEESKQIQEVPAKYEWIEERVLVREAHTEWKKGNGLVERIDEVTGEIICLIEVPAEYKTVKKKILVEPADVKEVIIPAEYTTVKVRKLVSPPQTKRITIPAEYQSVTRTVKASEGRMEWRRVLCETNLSSDVVLEIQQALSVSGYDPGNIDGVLGPRTHDAIKSYQEEEDLSVGGLTYETIRSLGIDLY